MWHHYDIAYTYMYCYNDVVTSTCMICTFFVLSCTVADPVKIASLNRFTSMLESLFDQEDQLSSDGM